MASWWRPIIVVMMNLATNRRVMTQFTLSPGCA